MEMVRAEAAGIGFSCDPRNGRQDVLVISANFGLGESVVGGAAEPDEYCLDTTPWFTRPVIREKRTGRKEGMTVFKDGGGTEFISSADLAGKQVLPDEQIVRLGSLIIRVYEALGAGDTHQDIEWVYDGRDFILVQARPVTVMPRCTFAELRNQPDIWSNGNYRDAVPMVVSTLGRGLLKQIIDIIHDTSFTAIGYRLPEGLQFSRYFHGRLYANISALQWAWYDAFGVRPRDFTGYWGGHQPEIEINDEKPLRGINGIKRIWRNIKNFSLIKKTAKNADGLFAAVSGPAAECLNRGFKDLADGQFAVVFDDTGRVLADFAREYWFLSSVANMPYFYLSGTFNKEFPGKAYGLVNALMAGGAEITSAEHGYKLVELAEIASRDVEARKFFSTETIRSQSWEQELPEKSPFKQAFRGFLKKYGHRGVYELDIINPRWREDTAYLLEIVGSTLDTANLAAIKDRQKEKSDAAWKEVDKKLSAARRRSVRKWVKQAQAGAGLREMAKSVIVMPLEVMRVIALEIGSRFVERGIIMEPEGIFHCAWPEMFAVLSGEWDGKGLALLADERRARRAEMEALASPDLIMGETPKFTEQAARVSGNALEGVRAAAGRATGTARLVNHPNEGERLKSGEVLIAPSTDPGWTPLFLKASAIVMETGGYLSHGAIVAREYGIPAVINIAGVMKLIKDGRQVTVDGDEGKVFLT